MRAIYLKLNLNFLFIYLLFKSIAKSQECNDSENCECGTPARPPGIEIFVKKFVNHSIGYTFVPYKEYSDDDDDYVEPQLAVWYRCIDTNDLLIGTEMRKCINGKWIGAVPRCAVNYLNETELTSVEILDKDKRTKLSALHSRYRSNSLGAFTPPVYRHPYNCIEWKSGHEQIWFFKLKKQVEIHYIKLKLFGEKIGQHLIDNELKFKVNLNNNVGPECQLSNRSSVDIKKSSKISKNSITLEFSCELIGLKKTNRSNTSHAIYIFFSIEKYIKLFPISVCELRVYHFEDNCGSPDYPVSTKARSFKEHEGIQWEYNCRDNDHILEGHTIVKCLQYGKWRDDFPICVLKTKCQQLDNHIKDEIITIRYELTMIDENGNTVIPNGKMAFYSCNLLKQNEINISDPSVSRVICGSGKWIGLSSDGTLCPSTMHFESSISRPVIRIMSGLLVLCLILIVCLIVYMFTTRKRIHKQAMDEIKNGMNAYGDDYDVCDINSNIYEQTPEEYDYINYETNAVNSTYSVDRLENSKVNSIYNNEP